MGGLQLKNSLQAESCSYLNLAGGVELIAKAALAQSSAFSLIQLGEIKGMTPAQQKSIVIPRVEEISECAFLGSSRIKAVILGCGVKKVKSLAFSKSPNLSLAIIHDEVVDLDSNAFFGCENLKFVIASEKLVGKIKNFS